MINDSITNILFSGFLRSQDELPPLLATRCHHGTYVDRGPRGRLGRHGGGLVRLRGAEHDARALHIRLVHVQQEGRGEPQGEAVWRQAHLPAGDGSHIAEDEARN